jgi:glycosyltransferase involved in cell wall biosynthesis
MKKPISKTNKLDSISSHNLIGSKRPQWSVMIPVCNRVKYLRKTLESVLLQDPGADLMQICIVDNSTNDRNLSEFLTPAEAARVEIVKQATHIPLTDNWNSCIKLAQGDFIHILHDDDFVHDGFYKAIHDASVNFPDCGLYFCRCFLIDEFDEIIGITERLSAMEVPSYQPGNLLYNNHMLCPGVVVKRESYEKLGGFESKYFFCSDWHMWLRIISNVSGLCVNKPLASYRIHCGSGTSALEKSGQNLTDLFLFGGWIEESFKDFSRTNFNSYCVHYGRSVLAKAARSWNPTEINRFQSILRKIENSTAHLSFFQRCIRLTRRVASSIKNF